MHWKDFFYFSPANKAALLGLTVIVVIILVFHVLLPYKNSASISIPQNDSLIAALDRLQQSLEDEKIENERYDYNPNKKTTQQNARSTASITNKSNGATNYPKKPHYVKQEKFTAHGSISLNETDTAEWKKVPGIGSAYSARIVKYGSMLGGYISINQLKEVYGFTDELFDAVAPFVCEEEVGSGNCAKINTNQLTFKEILAHPYISFEQTKAIMNLRKRTGDITSINQLAMLEEFTSADIERIAPYLDF